jgi:hypothetical protein
MSDSPAYAGLAWRKSSFSGGDGCLEAAPYRDGLVAIRDSKDPASPVLFYTPHEWQAFLAGVRNNEFDSLPMEAL